MSWLDKIKQGVIWSYSGGFHPITNKHNIDCTMPDSIQPEPETELVIPLQQHIGQVGQLVVTVGDTVTKGQALTQAHFYQAPPVHAPCCGEVIAIEPRSSAHPSGIAELSVVIKANNENKKAYLVPLSDAELNPEVICQRAHQAGLAGMGGAGFPTALKITPSHPLKVLIINGAECEPYISADDCLMRHYAEQILRGVSLLGKALSPEITIIAVEDDKPEALAALREQASDDVLIRAIPTKYPSGGEKQLIEVLTGQQVPSGTLPVQMGLLVQNVATAYALHRAVDLGEPLIQRLVTLAGDLVTKPCNYWVPIGTKISHLVKDKLRQSPSQPAILGGSMMGFMLNSHQAPITKTANCILFNQAQELPNESPCIRCGACAEACPMGLLPQELFWFSKGQQHDKARQYNLMDCIECGACAAVCPSQIPLVQYYREEKAQLKADDLAKQDAERAKRRHDARQERLESEQQARKDRHKQAALRRQQQSDTTTNDPVKAALARVKRKTGEIQVTLDEHGQPIPDNSAAIAARKAKKAQTKASATTAQSTDAANPAVAAAIARAKAKKQAQAAASEDTEPNSSDSESAVEPKKSSANPAVAAAIARAKAKKQAQAAASEAAESSSSGSESAVEPKKSSANPAVAAAIARAKAKKQAKAGASEAPEPNSSDSESVVEPKKSSANPAVAAAIARAKAKQQAQAAASEATEPNSSDSESAVEPKKSSANPAVAAAIARAKAKKQARIDTTDTAGQARSNKDNHE